MTLRPNFFHLLALSAIGLPLAACTDAGRCERGDPECAPTLQGLCNSGAEPIDGRCPEDDLNSPDGGGGRAGSGGAGSGGAPARVRPAWRAPGEPPDVSCSSGTVEELCEEFCEALCQNQMRFCGRSECRANACEPNGEVLGPCVRTCAPSGEEDDDALACATLLCNDQIEETLLCEDFGFLDRNNGVFETLCLLSDPVCAQDPELGCSKTCGTNDGVGGQLVDNEICEDGVPDDSDALRCPRGTDCGDCPAHPCAAPGDPCSNHGECCGFFGAGALCATEGAADDEELGSCRQGCKDDLPCPDGYSCVDTTQIPVCVKD